LLDLPDVPGIKVVASGFFGSDRGVGFVLFEEGAGPTFNLSAGSRQQVRKQLDFRTNDDEDLALFAEDDVPKLHRKIDAAAKAAEAGKAFGPTRVRGTDLGNMQVETVDGKVRVSVLPFGVEEPYPEQFRPDRLTEVEDDDGIIRPPTAAEVAEYLAVQKAEYEAEVAEYNAELAARRQRLTATLSADEARRLSAALDLPARPLR